MSYTTVPEVRTAASPNGGTNNPPDEPTGTAADLPNSTIQDAINEADSYIDSKLTGRYVTPVAVLPDGSVPHPIDWWSRNIALYLATLTFRGAQDFSDDDPVARRYNATVQALADVQAGKASLPGTVPEIGDSGSGGAQGAGAPYNQYPSAMFGQDQFVIDGAVQGPVTDNPFGTYWSPAWGG